MRCQLEASSCSVGPAASPEGPTSVMLRLRRGERRRHRVVGLAHADPRLGVDPLIGLPTLGQGVMMQRCHGEWTVATLRSRARKWHTSSLTARIWSEPAIGRLEEYYVADADAQREAPLIVRHGESVVRVVSGGNHVTNLLLAGVTRNSVDAVEVRADPGGGPPPHRHHFGEWFYVLEGELLITGDVNGAIGALATIGPGDSAWVPPQCWHGTVNDSTEQVRFLVVGQPAVMTDYFAQAGVEVPDERTVPAVPPPSPNQLLSLADAIGITFFPRP